MHRLIHTVSIMFALVILTTAFGMFYTPPATINMAMEKLTDISDAIDDSNARSTYQLVVLLNGKDRRYIHLSPCAKNDNDCKDKLFIDFKHLKEQGLHDIPNHKDILMKTSATDYLLYYPACFSNSTLIALLWGLIPLAFLFTFTPERIKQWTRKY